jgi:hypothetical protein
MDIKSGEDYQSVWLGEDVDSIVRVFSERQILVDSQFTPTPQRRVFRI